MVSIAYFLTKAWDVDKEQIALYVATVLSISSV